MPIQYPGGPRPQSPTDIANRHVNANQLQTNNALINDAHRMKNQGLKTDYADAEKLKIAREMKVVSERGIEMMNRGVPVDSFRDDLADWFMQRGMDVSRIPQAGSDSREFMEGFENLGRSADDIIAALAPQMQDINDSTEMPYAQRHPITGKVSMVGATPRGPTANMQDFQRLQEIGNQYGVESPEYQQFAAQLVTPKYGELGGVMNRFGSDGSAPEPLSTREAEISFVADEAAARESATTDVDAREGYVQRQQANRDTYAIYEVARNGMMTGLEGTETGYFAGKIPPITAGQQIAEGGVSAMAPVLKQLFRAAGEGVFTDKDQELLMSMIPTRNDLAAARLAKMENIDLIVRGKLQIDDLEKLQQARDAIAKGAPEEQVKEMLSAMGIDPRKL